MNPLPQQPEDKKISKIVGKIRPTCDEVDEMSEYEWISLILPVKAYKLGYEQAIAEIKKQRQEILDKIDKCCDDDWYEKEDIDGRDCDYNEVVDRVKEHIKQQLNQPKTENGKNI